MNARPLSLRNHAGLLALLVALHLVGGIPVTATAEPAPPGIATANVDAFRPVALRCEYLVEPRGIDATQPRLSWRIEAPRRGAAQTAWQVLVAASAAALARDDGDLWDSGKVTGDTTSQIVYAGRALPSRAFCHWKVRAWDENGQPGPWSTAATWTMGLLQPGDWTATWISFRDTTPLHMERATLSLPPAAHYRREFDAAKPVRRATLYASALGLCELQLNGERVGDACFQPGWSDYAQRAHYRVHDVTALMMSGVNALGAIVAEGWYAGYVGYGELVGYGPHRTGKNFYGKTPALLAQLEIEYVDGTKASVVTDPTWRVTRAGPIREADILMGETYDARLELGEWARAGFGAANWEGAIPASENPAVEAPFTDALGIRTVHLGFRAPPRLQAYSAPPIRITEELPTRLITSPGAGVHIFDFGQNFAGVARLSVKGPAGTIVRLRFGEMLHRDGTLMTENLRQARATDTYVLRGDPAGEEWTPRFTYHGFRYVELTGLPEAPTPATLTGLVLHNDTPLTGNFECSDEVMTRFALNAVWTQRANYFEVPTDCPQRDERLGWMGDAQAYVRTASFNADIAAFFTKWLDDVAEAQLSFGAYPDYAPYPMAHGQPGKNFGTAWTDAGIICPWTLWKVYGDTRVIERHWPGMTRFMDWRRASTAPDGGGTSIGNPWGDWLNVNDPTPVEYVDTCYHALVCAQMAEMAAASGRAAEAANYRHRLERVQRAFGQRYLASDGTLKVTSQTAHVLALWAGLLAPPLRAPTAARLAGLIAANGNRMSTGFLGTRALLLALSENGQHDTAVRLFQNRVYPSWGYEVVNGATSVWERWDSFTTEHGFEGKDGKQNAAMNSFSHYAFGAVMEWAYRVLAGIDTRGEGYRHILIRPRPPSPAAHPGAAPLQWVRAHYDSPHGRIVSAWRQTDGRFELDVTIPANTRATVWLPTNQVAAVTEGGVALARVDGVGEARLESGEVRVDVGAGSYRFAVAPASPQP